MAKKPDKHDKPQKRDEPAWRDLARKTPHVIKHRDELTIGNESSPVWNWHEEMSCIEHGGRCQWGGLLNDG